MTSNIPAAPMEPKIKNACPMVLHFDLNRTILMSDAAGGRSVEDVVNYLLTEVTWGTTKRMEDGEMEWVCASVQPSSTRPNEAQAHGNEEWMTYKAFVDQVYPYKNLKEESEKENGMDSASVKQFNKKAKANRTALQSKFTNPGAPGRAVLSYFQELMKELHFPNGEIREHAKALATGLPDSRLKDAWSNGRYYLLPSFLRFLYHVADSGNSDDLISLVFRTFGDDALLVAQELEILSTGKHPLFPGKLLPKEFTITDAKSQFGVFYRDGFDSQGTILAKGTVEKVPSSALANAATKQDAVRAFYDQINVGSSKVELIEGFKPIYEHINGLVLPVSNGDAPKFRLMALRDYWEWWSAHGESPEYGKLLLIEEKVNQSAKKNHPVFLDDHIEHHGAHIVDVRDISSASQSEVVPFTESMRRRHLKRVEPYDAIMDQSYFIKVVEALLE